MAERARAAPRLDLLVVGHTNVDRFFDVPRLPGRDRTVPVDRTREALGGTAANLAIAASREGVRCGLASFVGADLPERFRARLAAHRIDLGGLVKVPGERTPSCLVVEDGNGSQFTLIDQGAMGDARGRRTPDRLIAASRWVHLTTGDPAFQLRILEVARRLGRPATADPAQEVHYRWSPEELRRLVVGSEILMGNQDEIEAVRVGLGLPRASSLLDLVPLVIETRGAKGARALSRAGTVVVPADRPRKVPHVTGAGDAFRGGFYAGWFRGAPLADCLRAGTRTARRWLTEGGEGA